MAKVIDGHLYEYCNVGLTKEQYKILKKKNPHKRYRKVGIDIYESVRNYWRRFYIRQRGNVSEEQNMLLLSMMEKRNIKMVLLSMILEHSRIR